MQAEITTQNKLSNTKSYHGWFKAYFNEVYGVYGGYGLPLFGLEVIF